MNLGVYYYIDKTKELDGFQYVHKKGCKKEVNISYRIFIGTLYTEYQALTTAKMHVKKVRLCRFCCM